MGERAKRIMSLMLYLGVFIVGIVFFPARIVFAADTAVRVYSVEYKKEQIKILNNGNSKIYYATETDASKDKWDEVEADRNADGSIATYTTIDFSWLSSASENVIVIKGADNKESRIVIGKKPSKLSINIDYSKMSSLNKNDTIARMVNIMADVGDGVEPIDFTDLQWRKGINCEWQEYNTLTVGELGKFLVKGADLYFRIKAVDDDKIEKDSAGNVTRYPDGTKGMRFSGEVRVKIPKQAAAATYTVDGSKLTVNVRSGKEYRVALSNGSFSPWIAVTNKSVKSVSLVEMLNKANKNSGNSTGLEKGYELPAMTIEIRDYATNKAAASKSAIITIDKQRTLDQSLLKTRSIEDDSLTNNNNIYVSYSGNSYLLLQIPAASSDNQYEYCIFKKGEPFNLEKAAWTAVTKGTEIKIPSSKAVDGGTLYVRMKEIKPKKTPASSQDNKVILASTYVKHEIKYPSTPVIAVASYTFTRKFSGDITFDVTLGASPFETSIDSITLGASKIDFNEVSSENGGVHKLTVTLKKESLAALPNCTNQNITITFKKGTIIKNAIKLTVKDPTAPGELTVTVTPGSSAGKTSFSIGGTKATGNKWIYVIGNNKIDEVYKENKIADKTSLTQKDITGSAVNDISVSAGQFLTVFEVDSNGYIVKYKCIEIKSDMIKS